jgi:hypothetical protein
MVWEPTSVSSKSFGPATSARFTARKQPWIKYSMMSLASDLERLNEHLP